VTHAGDPRAADRPDVDRPRVLVFCGAGIGHDPAFAIAAKAFGRLLGERRLGVVFGGGRVGLMGALASGALAAGADVIGVIPRSLVDRELAHAGLSRLEIVGSMHERKTRMLALSDAVVALPGGLGTLDELFEAWTWAGLGLHDRPIGLLDVGGYWRPLVALVDAMTAAGFVRAEDRARLLVDDAPDALLDRLVGLDAGAD
jgi:uncharacterized protein (TIGR00730 family)